MFVHELKTAILSRDIQRSLVFRRFVKRLPPRPGKPPLIPPARGKRYTIIHVPWQDPADAKELLWRRHIYNDAVASYRTMYKRMNEEQMKGAMGAEAIQRREDEEFRLALKENEEENRRVAEYRKNHLREQIRKIEEDTLREIDVVVREEEKSLREREAEVLAMVAQSKEFVTLENLEQNILDALENPKEYNHAIDLDGNVYEGDKFLSYLHEAPLASTPISEITAPLKKVGRYEEGNGKIVRTEDPVSARSG